MFGCSKLENQKLSEIPQSNQGQQVEQANDTDLKQSTASGQFGIPKIEPIRIDTATAGAKAKLSFNAAGAFTNVVLRAQRFDPSKAPFGESDFIQDITMTCVKVRNGDFIAGETEVFKMNPLHYANLETAAGLADALGAELTSIKIEGFPCTASHLQYILRFKLDDEHIVDLNAGLVANSFNQNPEWLSLLRVRTEIAHGWNMPVPNWNQAAEALNCGDYVLGIRLIPDPTLGGQCRQ